MTEDGAQDKCVSIESVVIIPLEHWFHCRCLSLVSQGVRIELLGLDWPPQHLTHESGHLVTIQMALRTQFKRAIDKLVFSQGKSRDFGDIPIVYAREFCFCGPGLSEHSAFDHAPP